MGATPVAAELRRFAELSGTGDDGAPRAAAGITGPRGPERLPAIVTGSKPPDAVRRAFKLLTSSKVRVHRLSPALGIGA